MREQITCCSKIYNKIEHFYLATDTKIKLLEIKVREAPMIYSCYQRKNTIISHELGF